MRWWQPRNPSHLLCIHFIPLSISSEWVESSLDICSRRRTRCTVTTAPDVDDGTRHPQLQPALSSAGTDEWVLSWRLNEDSDSSGDRRAAGSRFQVLGPYTAKLRWPVDVRVQGTRRAPETAEREWQRQSVDAVGTEVGQITWRCVVQTLPYSSNTVLKITRWRTGSRWSVARIGVVMWSWRRAPETRRAAAFWYQERVLDNANDAMIGGENKLKLMRTQEMGNFNNYCNVACLKLKLKVKLCQKNGLFKNHVLFERSEATPIRCRSSAFHNVQRWHFPSVTDRFINVNVKLRQDSVHRRSQTFSLIFDRVIHKAREWTFFWDAL